MVTAMPAESAASCATASLPAHASDMALDGSSGDVAAASSDQLLPQQDAQGLTERSRAQVRASANLGSQLPRVAGLEGSAAVCRAATGEPQDFELLRPTAGVDAHASAAVTARQPLAEARLLSEGQGGPLPAQAGKGNTQPAESRSPNRAPRAPGKPKSPAFGGKFVGKRLPAVGGMGLKGIKDTNSMPGAPQILQDGSAATTFLATYVVDFGAVAIGTLKVYSQALACPMLPCWRKTGIECRSKCIHVHLKDESSQLLCIMWWPLLFPRALPACQECVQYFNQLKRACMAWQVRHFRVVNTCAQAVVCSLAAPLPESSGFALAPGRFTLPPAPPNGDLPSVEATATLLVSFYALQMFVWLRQVLLHCTVLKLMATSTICTYCDLIHGHNFKTSAGQPHTVALNLERPGSGRHPNSYSYRGVATLPKKSEFMRSIAF